MQKVCEYYCTPEYLQQFAEYMNKHHSKIRFSGEANGALPFLDVKIYKENGKFVTSVYRTETFSGVYTIFPSFILLDYKVGLSSGGILGLFGQWYTDFKHI